MKLCFCPLMEYDEQEVIKNSKKLPTLSISNFNKNLLRGFESILADDLTVLSTRLIPSYPNYPHIIQKRKMNFFNNLKCLQIGFINLPILKYISEYFGLVIALKKWCQINSDDNLVVCSYGRRISHSLAINTIKKKYPNIKTFMIYGDLSGANATQITNVNKIMYKYQKKILDYSIKQSLKFDGSIFLTEQMSQVLNNIKPYLVIEGFCDSNILELNINKKKKSDRKKKVILYTGIISRQYNFDIILDAMSYLGDDFELVLYGFGPMTHYIETSKVNNVKFLGYIEPEKIRDIQFEADILINPRQNVNEFTKYSFPSKTLEYLVTGNPLIGYKLDGIPDEYDDFIFYPADNSVTELVATIKRVASLNNNELVDYKEDVFKFLAKKTNVYQCQKAIDFFENLNR